MKLFWNLAAVLVLLAAPSLNAQDLVSVPGGTFTMGSAPGFPGRGEDETRHQVTLSPYRIARYDVTVAAFRAFVQATKFVTQAEKSGYGTIETEAGAARVKGSNWKTAFGVVADDRNPVVLVTWNEAVAYCNWLSAQNGLTPAYTIQGGVVTWSRKANGYRLPTEAEWEYAAQGGGVSPTPSLFFAGSDYVSTNIDRSDSDAVQKQGEALRDALKSIAWTSFDFEENGAVGFDVRPVGLKAPNALGVYDLTGNVNQWVWDAWAPYPTSPTTDPMGPAKRLDRIARGSSFFDYGYHLTARTERRTPNESTDWIGFRLAQNEQP